MNFNEQITKLLANSNLGEIQTMYLAEVITLISLICLIILVHLLLKKTLLRGIEKFVQFSKTDWDDKFLEKGVFKKVTVLMPWILGQLSLPYFLAEDSSLFLLALKVFQLGLLIQVTLIITSSLTVILDIYKSVEKSHEIPIDGFIQIIKLIVFFFTAILSIAILLNKPPLLLLSGLGALSAVIMLVFKDTLLGFVAGVQLIGNKMIKPDDRIEMERYGADGTVQEVALTTVKVKNWDNTISTIPTSSLVSDSFRNWRGMKDVGFRMISRSLLINTRTVKFCDLKLLESLLDLNLIHESVKKLIKELNEDDKQKIRPSNKRRMTNLGIFRHYIIKYLQQHENISNDPDYISIVGENEPTEKGVGVSIFAYYNGSDTLGYKNTVADIFDHLFAVIHEFELDFFQLPSDHMPDSTGNRGFVLQD